MNLVGEHGRVLANVPGNLDNESQADEKNYERRNMRMQIAQNKRKGRELGDSILHCS